MKPGNGVRGRGANAAGNALPRQRKQRPKVPISERATLTIEETAQYLGIGRQTAYDEARTGGLPIIRLGRSKKRIVVVRALLDEMILRRGREAWSQIESSIPEAAQRSGE
jgi:excisionase family DNA binding protein